MSLRTVLLAVVAFAFAFVAACSCGTPPASHPPPSGGTDAGPSCAAGTEGCPCDGGLCNGAGLTCDSGSDTCVAVAACPAGTLGCPCDESGACSDTAAVCTAGTCTAVECPAGQEGCACESGGGCALSASGQALTCGPGNLCTSSRCAPGDTGCVCRQGATCSNASDSCAPGGADGDPSVCVATGCAPGSQDCTCAGGQCNGSLRCFEGSVCLDARGSLGGGCFDDGTCQLGYRCDSGASCVPCSVGQQGCACDGGGCAEGLECGDNGVCAASVGFALAQPASPKCWTPCTGAGLQITAQDFRPCPADGLMADCLPGLSCVGGSCVPPDTDPAECNINTACPDFQSCLGGHCVSNCESNTDCVSIADCVSKVCRKRCTIVENNCPGGTFCATTDGEAGHCVETVDPGAPADLTLTNLSLSSDALVLSSTITGGSFRVTNGAVTTKRITLTKDLQREVNSGGVVDSVRLGPTSTPHLNQAACTPGSLGCRCSNADTHCLTTPLGEALTCNGDSICALSACSAGTAGCVCDADGTCGRVCAGPDCPLSFISMTARVNGQQVATGQDVALSFDLEPGAEALVDVAGAGGTSLPYYDGEITVDDGATKKGVAISYSHNPEGAWNGQMYTFGDFRVNDAGLANWLAKKNGTVTNGDVAGIKNAFLQAWANFRRGALTFDKFSALLTSTRTESWRDPVLASECGPDKVCFPFLNDDGFDTYTLDPAGEPVPSGVVELPFGMNLKQSNGTTFSGRVRSSAALQYGGNPAVTLQFANDPATCSTNNAAGCLVFLSSFSAQAQMGGRYHAASCAAPRYATVEVPWLVPGFVGGTTVDDVTGRRYTQECRDTLTPFTDPDTGSAQNQSLAGGNPVLDGKERTRRVDLVDGALINSDSMFVIYKETVPAVVGVSPDDDLVAYGYMFLTRESTVPDDADFIGNAPVANLPPPPAQPALACSADIQNLIRNKPWDAQVDVVMGQPALSAQVIIFSSTTTESTTEQVHYLCADTNRFDTVAECPAGSPVTFFTVNAAQLSKATIANDPCNTPGADGKGTCDAALDRFERNGQINQPNAAWQCEDANLAYCSSNRFDMKSQKRFFGAASQPLAFEEIHAAVDEAFTYRTRFQDRSGKNIGFAPDICEAGTQVVPYCYDPVGIEEIQERNDCLVSLYITRPGNADIATKTALEEYLRETFSYDEVIDPALNISVFHSGAEKLTGELQIMLGDDALTKALSSRFDLAGLQVASFPGDQLEPNGVNLSGVAGAEMLLLYQATQQYQMVLDRFFTLLPSMNSIIDNDSAADIIGASSIETYFDRVIRASTQKASAWNEISKHYENLGRPDLAELVIERAYTAATIESTVLTHTMTGVADKSQVQFLDGILASIRKAQVGYSAALNDMRTQRQQIGDDVNYFGFPPDHLPFPALEVQAARDTGFEVQLNRAQQRLELARGAEDAALATTRSFDTDSQSFQNELTRVQNTYEGQLSDLCGTFTAQGRVFPAIRKYASLSQAAQLFGDPCGRMGTGQIHDAAGNVDIQLVEMARVRQSMANLDAQISIEEERIDEVCATTNAFRNATIAIHNQESSVEGEIADWQNGLAAADRLYQAAATFASLTKCSVGTSSDCPTAAVSMTELAVAVGVNEAAQTFGQDHINDLESHVRDLQTDEAEISFAQQCQGADTDFAGQAVTDQGLAQIDSKATIKNLSLQMSTLQLDALREEYDMQQAVSQVEQLRNQSTRLQAEMEEVIQQTINVEAARNDPNVRIYKNDAVQAADTTFYSALREAFLATKVWEYTTSQTYADFNKLLLSRMVAKGDFNLEEYLVGLEDAYHAFEDEQGQADLRVDVLSLRDDILKVPRISVTGEPLSSAQRIDQLRQRLRDPQLLDDHGYISVSFNVGQADISPLTRNQKIEHVEAEIVTTGSTDPLARVYLRSSGTSAVLGIDGAMDFYTLPKRTAVINAFFSGDKVYEPDVYKSFRFQDRPLFNSRWDLILNTVDEPANTDLRTDDLTDIRIYIYYTDFTVY